MSLVEDVDFGCVGTAGRWLKEDSGRACLFKTPAAKISPFISADTSLFYQLFIAPQAFMSFGKGTELHLPFSISGSQLQSGNSAAPSEKLPAETELPLTFLGSHSTTT